MNLQPGMVVTFRKRTWVLLPSEEAETWALRPLTGTSEDRILVHRGLSTLLGYTLPEERPQPATFPWPQAEHVQDAAAVRLFWQAARLLLREGAAPLRSLGRISIRPRTYQLVPLMMALRQNPVRLLIADDVGVGKTIEAGLIARELWDRRVIRRIAVLVPPYLTDQWQKELAEKFNFDPVVIAPGTIHALERRLPADRSLYAYYPVQVISIDFIKTERNRHRFLLHAPEFVIVDEAHAATPATSQARHLRYELVRRLAQDRHRHLLLLTATPHSGIAEAFQRLLGLLDPAFETWDLARLTENQFARLARHFIQRTRRDIERHWENAPAFPKRETREVTYRLSPAYRRLFQEVYRFSKEIVRSAAGLREHQRRMRHWSALALLRCVMSSPKAARDALARRRQHAWLDLETEEESDLLAYVYEPAEETPPDELPHPLLEIAEAPEPASPRQEARRLRTLERLAAEIPPEADPKLQETLRILRDLLRKGYQPIVWCHYVATAAYVAEHARATLTRDFPDLQVMAVTGRMSEEERRMRVEELAKAPRRLLVATDCLSEGINLQEGFNAVLHYDLPWNPNRLEQREGRVDRYGQPSPVVQAVMLYGEDNPVDGAVIRVLLRKAREIRRTLGTHVPVPENDEKVIQALVNELFLRGHGREGQLSLDLGRSTIEELHRRWDFIARQEQETRTRFAQRHLDPAAVQRELEAADQILGHPDEVREFVRTAAQRLGLTIRARDPQHDIWEVLVDANGHLPPAIREALPVHAGTWTITFTSPTPAGATYLGRNHPFVTALARFLFEQALETPARAIAARVGAIRTRAVRQLTALFLLRARYLLHAGKRDPLLAEEIRVLGWEAFTTWLPHDQALNLLARAEPSGNIPDREKQELVQAVLGEAEPLLAADSVQEDNPIWNALQTRARELEVAHRRLLRHLGESGHGTSVRIQPHWPPDVLGILVLQPTLS